jgi:general secretion pathway protein F
VPEFRYTAATVAAETVAGRMEAASKAAVVDRLHALGHVPIRVEEVGTSALARLLATEIWRSRRVPARSLALVTGQLATLLRAGLALDEALAILQELVEKEAERGCLRLLLERISGGATLADAMAAQPEVFPEFYVSMVRAGEAGASLETVLERLADHLERSQETREHIRSALLYPVIVALTCCASLAALLLFVVPRFRPLFEQSGDALPASTRGLLAVSDFLQAWWWACVLVPAFGVLLLRRQTGRPESRERWQRRLLRLPLVGGLIQKVEVARFSRTLGTLLRNGVSLLPALAITRETTGNAVFAEAVAVIAERTATGKGLAEPMRQTGVFPPLAVHLVRVGEESGRQEEMLLKIAAIFEADTRRAVDRLLGLLAPAVTIVLGLVVAAVIMSILTALLGIYDLTM